MTIAYTSPGWATEPERAAGWAPARRPARSRMAGFLGWFSLGLGLAQVAAPRDFARGIGLNDDEDNAEAVRLVGLRELATGAGVLARPSPAGFLWGRVAGDLIDLALLGRALRSGPAEPGRVPAASLAVLGVAALDLREAIRHTGRR